MPVEALFAAGAVLADAFQIAQSVIFAARSFGIAVVQMENNTAELHAALVNCIVVEADAQLGIFESPASKRFVVAVDADQVVAPECHVTAPGASCGAECLVED